VVHEVGWSTAQAWMPVPTGRYVVGPATAGLPIVVCCRAPGGAVWTVWLQIRFDDGSVTSTVAAELLIRGSGPTLWDAETSDAVAPPGPAAARPRAPIVPTQLGVEPEQPTEPASSNHACPGTKSASWPSISSCSYRRPFTAIIAPVRPHPIVASQSGTVPRHVGAQTFGEPLHPAVPAAS